MGTCCCKSNCVSEDPYSPPTSSDPGSPTPSIPVMAATRPPHVEIVNDSIVDQLVLETLGLIASFVDNDEESPVPLVKLHMIADKEDGWIQLVCSMINVIPLDDPFGPSVITILLDDCALPAKESVIKITRLFYLSSQRVVMGDCNLTVERNICVVLGCIAEKLAGPNSVAILTDSTLDYLIAYLRIQRDPIPLLFALIALEKFAQTTENKLTIKKRIAEGAVNPLLSLEQRADDSDYNWRQVGFCAKWSLDNIFIVEGRELSYETVDMTGINVMLNTNDVSEYLKISPNGLEARSDSYSFESVRCTFKVDEGCWYYEATVITPGVMQIGWATKNSHFLNHEGFGIGDDLYSLSYDGCRKLIWYKAHPTPQDMPGWRAGDVLGCLLDLSAMEVIFSLNGKRLKPCKDIFDITKFGFFAAASFMSFQQCQFNFGHKPFSYPPTDRAFSYFNEHGTLSEDQKHVFPRHVYLQRLRCFSDKEDSCTICCDNTACCVLEPCQHRGFCSLCTSQLTECPMCRGPIANVREEPLTETT